MCLWVTIAVGVLAGVVALSFIFLPAWGALLVLAVLAVTFALSFKWIINKVIERFALGLIDMKSKVLRDAEAVVHSVKPAQRPEEAGESDDDDEEEQPQAPVERVFYKVEATITPKPQSGKFGMWDVDDLIFVPFEMKVTRSADADDDDDTCHVRSVLIHVDGQYQELEGPKLEGAQRLEFLIGVKPGHKRLKFRYYFEAFGDIRLP